jgi:SH3-like domain-containing protein
MGNRISLLLLSAVFCLPAQGADKGYAAKAVDLLDRPGSQSKILAKLAKRQPVEIIGREGSWAKAKSGNATGWVRVADLRITVAASKLPTP